MAIVETLEQLSDCIDFSYHLVRDEFNGREGPTVWSCSINCNGKSYTAEYTKGCGHRVYTNAYGTPTNKRIVVPFGKMAFNALEANKRSVPVHPDLTEFMYALVMDAGCGRDNDFEDFCSEFGYDTDSISASKTYDACCRTYMALSRMGLELDRLSELFQDY